MNKIYGSLIVAGASIPVFAIAYFQASSVQTFVEKLNGAGSVQLSATSVAIGSPASTWTLTCSKPNMFKLVNNDTTIVADGKNVTTYTKSSNEYYVVPETATSITDSLTQSQYSLWRAFFDSKALGSPIQSQSLGTDSINGSSYDKVQVQLPSGDQKNAVLYFDSSSSMPAKAKLSAAGNSSSLQVINFNTVTLGGPLDASKFAFTPPDGAKKVDAASLTDATWYTDLSKAEDVAAKTHRYVFVDFFATWCGPCKMLQHEVLDTPDFNKLSKYFVFVRIDTDQQPTVSQKYNITALPTQAIMDSQGTVLAQTVGYGGADPFYQFIQPWEKSAP